MRRRGSPGRSARTGSRIERMCRAGWGGLPSSGIRRPRSGGLTKVEVTTIFQVACTRSGSTRGRRLNFISRVSSAVTNRDASILVEACVDSVSSSLAAERGGARRVELCDALFDGGTTPSAGMIAACKAAVSIPVFVIIRPRGGGFVYSSAERDVMRRDVAAARELGADGMVIGGLHVDGTIDLPLVRMLV